MDSVICDFVAAIMLKEQVLLSDFTINVSNWGGNTFNNRKKSYC